MDDVEAGVAGDRRLELARQIRQRLVTDEPLDDLGDHRGGIDDLVRGDTGHRRAEDHPGSVATGLDGLHSGTLQAAPDLGHGLDGDPVELEILPIGDVGGAAGEVTRDPGQRADLLGAERAAVQPDPHHEVTVGQLVGGQLGGPGTVDALAALGIKTPPAHPAMQII